MYQEAGLYTSLGGLISAQLWHLWLLVLTGEPLLVYGPRPDIVSRAVLALASLIAPVHYGGDVRPYMTIHDPDFSDVRQGGVTVGGGGRGAGVGGGGWRMWEGGGRDGRW